MEQNVFIPKTPRKMNLGVQSEKVRNRRQKDWTHLLNALPYCEKIKDFNKIVDYTGFVHDQREIFEQSYFIYALNYDASYQEDIYIILYFCFLKNGSFTIVYDGNIETAETEDDIAKSLYEFSNESAISWVKGYRLIVKIIQKSFHFKVPRVPSR
jgi:hypothetical protein